MGEANQRGNAEQRREQALERNLDEAEVLIFLKADQGKVTMGMLARDDPANQDSPAVILAAYLSANFEQLAGEAMRLHMSHGAMQRGEMPMEGSVPGVIAETPVRSILTAEGDVARVDEVKLLGPDGARLQ